MASVKVAVRVRPLNKREKDLDCKICIKVHDKKTTIINPSSNLDAKDFSYDHSYWSVDSRDKHFATQEQVFSNLGTDVIASAFDGYNACIFAYGQTGAGKSYTMMGMQEAFGLIPRICEGMYERMATDQANTNNKVEFKTEVSYLEIYNESVRDLLRPPSKKGGDVFNLKVREHPKEGPYVQDLTKHLVSKYTDIEKLMDLGNEHRTTASTSMNDTSSRSHAIFTLNFTQAKFFTDMPSETVSKIHLVDLAGSERANSTGATGQRLKEGANINKSLVTLGSVISALADLSGQDGKKKVFIPYRDSVLTWLLKDSLGGNAKTIMIAAISPADVNYHETLSTLRYANRAKNIINKPTVNEDPNVKLIRDLRDEIENLRKMLQATNAAGVHLNVAEESKVTEKLHQNEAKVEQLTRDWNKKWQETQKIMEEAALAFRREGFGIKMESDLPHLICVDDDILSTGITMYHLSDGKTYVGREHGQVKQDLLLRGPAIEASHCIIESIEGNVTIHPIAQECYVNGHRINKATRLTQGAVLLLGKTNMFRFNHPAEAAKLRQKYASVENLASMVPSGGSETEPSYLFYNAGLAMERRYREEARMLDEKRKEIEKKQQEDLKKLDEAKKQLEELHTQKKAEEESQRKEMESTQKMLDDERKSLLAVKTEQEMSRRKVRDELSELKSRILQEQDEEKRKLDEEMNRLLSLKEKHKETVKIQEEELEKQQQVIAEQRQKETEELERQRAEVERLQKEFECARAESSLDTPLTTLEEEAAKPVADGEEADDIITGPTSMELRKKLDLLEETYNAAVKLAQKEIMLAKEALKQAEMATVQGKIGFAEGKMAVQEEWKKLDSLRSKHKKIEDDIQVETNALREILEKAERDEENSLLQRKQSILDRKRKRKKVEEATQKLAQMERTMSMSDENDLKSSKEMLDWQMKEEAHELVEQRKILMELLGKHQVALVKASQLVTETKTKLENHLENEKIIIEPMRDTIATVEKELEPLNMLGNQIERRAAAYEREMRERKKTLYKQRKRITLLEKQHAQSSREMDGLTKEEMEDMENDRDAEVELILKEKSLLKEMEAKYKEMQEETEMHITEATQELERRKGKLETRLTEEKAKLQEVTVVHQETTEFVEAELQAREEMLKRVKDKVVHDKRELAKLDMKHRRTESKAAEELFMMAEVLEKELGESGKKDELARIRDHRRKLQELDRQLRLAERKEKFTARADGEDPQQCVLL